MIVIVMGVVGSGKTTIGSLLAAERSWQFADADEFHPQANVEKIRHGIPLTDADREPWLERLRHGNRSLDCGRPQRGARVFGPEARLPPRTRSQSPGSFWYILKEKLPT